MITIPVWSLLLTSVLAGVVFMLVLLRLLTAAFSGPLADHACPCCGRPADSEVNRYRRMLQKMHENTARLIAERHEVSGLTLALLRAQTRHLMADTAARRNDDTDESGSRQDEQDEDA